MAINPREERRRDDESGSNGEEEKQNDSMSRHRGEDYISQPARTGTIQRRKIMIK